MKKTFSILAVAVVVLLSSCKKENVSDPGNPGVTVSKKLKECQEGLVNHSFTYNAEGKLATRTRIMNTDTLRFNFTYSQGKINYLSYVNSRNVPSDEGEMTIVNGQVAKHVWTYFDYFGNPITTFNEVFSYDAKGLLTGYTSNNLPSRTYKYDNNGNLIESIAYTYQGQPSTKAEYTYTNKADLCPQFGYFDNYIMGFFLPAKSKQLPAKLKVTDLTTNQVTYEGGFDYEFDNHGYMIKSIYNPITGGSQPFTTINIYQ